MNVLVLVPSSHTLHLNMATMPKPATNLLLNQHQQRRILVFLDIDGVLLPFPNSTESTCGAIFPDDCLAALSTILATCPTTSSSMELILSSTWRSQPNSVSDILDSFELYGKSHGGPLAKIQSFADMTDPTFHAERQHEIYRYLLGGKNNNACQKTTAWVVLDDEELLEGKVNQNHRSIFQGHVVKTKSRLGLTATDAALAIRLLHQQLDMDITTTSNA
jgi:HAD domain in Swiss Army Knife RNA repair proteins